MQTPGMALRSVISKSGLGVYASSDILYRGAVFGRDSLEVAEDLLLTHPRLVKKIIFTLISLQGRNYNALSEEEPGRIVHEYRTVIVDGKHIDESSMKIFKMLSEKWGGTAEAMTYYGSVDATPLFVRVVGKYCQAYGVDILKKTVKCKDGSEVTVREAMQRSCQWIIRKIEASKSGFVEFMPVNPNGIQNQVWKDSNEFYVHEDGEQVNHDGPIGSIEVQGITYDALLYAADIFPDELAVYMDAAKKLQATIFHDLWMGDRGYFALGTDFKGDKVRRIATLSANQGALLDTRLFDNLDEVEKQVYIQGIVVTLLGPDFLTDAGIRSRALSAYQLVGFWDYHGSFVSWIKETYDIAKGLKRQGFPELARQLENRLLNVCLRYKAYPEFVYVDRAGRVFASSPKPHAHGPIMTVDGTNQPERVQAWTVSAISAIVSSRLRNKLKKQTVRQNSWQHTLEDQLIVSIPNVGRYLNPAALNIKYPSYPYKVSRSSL